MKIREILNGFGPQKRLHHPNPLIAGYYIAQRENSSVIDRLSCKLSCGKKGRVCQMNQEEVDSFRNTGGSEKYTVIYGIHFINYGENWVRCTFLAFYQNTYKERLISKVLIGHPECRIDQLMQWLEIRNCLRRIRQEFMQNFPSNEPLGIPRVLLR